MSETTSSPAAAADTASGGSAAAAAGGGSPGVAAAADAAGAAGAGTAIEASVLTGPAVAPGEEKAAQEKAGADGADAGKDGAKPDAEVKPVEYTAFELPEGLSAENPALSAFREEAARLGLSQDQAQALVSKVGAQVADAAAAQMAAWTKMNTDWQAAVKADKEIGGDNFEPMRINVARLFDDFVGPVNSPERKALNQALLLTGAGNNPAIVKAFARVAAALGEGRPVTGSPARASASTAQLLYPTHNQK